MPSAQSQNSRYKISTTTKRPSGSNVESAIIFPDNNWTTNRNTITSTVATTEISSKTTGMKYVVKHLPVEAF